MYVWCIGSYYPNLDQVKLNCWKILFNDGDDDNETTTKIKHFRINGLLNLNLRNIWVFNWVYLNKSIYLYYESLCIYIYIMIYDDD